METLGHSTITVTMNVYAHVIASQERDAADRMDVALGFLIATPIATPGRDAGETRDHRQVESCVKLWCRSRELNPDEVALNGV